MASTQRTIVTVATTQHDARGHIQELHLISSSKDDVHSLNLGSNVNADAEYKEQIHRAAQYLQAFLRNRLFAQVCVAERLASRLEITPSSDEKLERGSHGLAILLAGLAHVLDVPLRRNCVFTAKLAAFEPEHDVIALDAVSGISAKALAAGRHGVNLLYYHLVPDDEGLIEEKRIDRHLQAHFRGEGDYHCRPIALPRRLLWGNLINLGLDTSHLWPRLLDDLEIPAEVILTIACQLLQVALFKPAGIGEFPDDVGKVIAALRARGSCPPTLPEQLGLRQLAELCTEEHLPQLVKAAISVSPDENVETDLATWASNEIESTELNTNKTPLSRVLWLHDIACAQGWIEDEIERHLRRTIVTRLTKTFSNLSGNESAKQQLYELTSTLVRLRTQQEEIIQEAIRSLETIFRRAPEDLKSGIISAIQQLARKIITPNAILAGKQPPLMLTFSSLGKQLEEKDDSIVPIINPLQVTYTGGDKLNLTIPSPVLLVEQAQHLGSYSRRSRYRGRDGFRLSDDTLARCSAEDASYLSSAFNSVPNRIEFKLQRSAAETQDTVGVLWLHERVPFPPAIDSQFLVNGVQRWCREDSDKAASIRSILDVGCGTGFLAASAAYLCPRVDEIMLIDLDDTTVTLAAENIRTAIRSEDTQSGKVEYSNVAPNARIKLFTGEFRKYKADDRFDLVIVNPPYLPELQLADTGIQRATNGTKLLEEIVERAPTLARYTWMTFSSLSWREFEYALAPRLQNFKRIAVYDRQFVPLRITTIEPVRPDELRDANPFAQQQFEQRLHYYDSVLRPRGLVDLDDEQWERKLPTKVVNSAVQFFAGTPNATDVEDVSGMNKERYKSVMDTLYEDSRGFRFWHETRVILLESK
ncbi:MAG: methyltransferase [Phycisphaerales bacterium]|nr:methyltransferase [Phycisphaerales bacterium]